MNRSDNTPDHKPPPWWAVACFHAGVMMMLAALFHNHVTFVRGTGMQFVIAAVLVCLADGLLVLAFRNGGRHERALSVVAMLPTLYILPGFLLRLPHLWPRLRDMMLD